MMRTVKTRKWDSQTYPEPGPLFSTSIDTDAGHDLDRSEIEYKAKIEQMQRSGQREVIVGKSKGRKRTSP